MKEAANLTFISMVAIIPMLSFAFLILPNILNVDKSVYIARILDNFIPETAAKVKELIELALNKKVSLNIYSFIFVGFSSFSMFNILNKTFDKILDIHQSHQIDIFAKLTKFIGSIFFGFLLMILIFTLVSASVIQEIPVISTFARVVSYFIPIILQFTLLTILYLFMPSIRISKNDLIKGTLITTLAWYIAKFAFDIYVRNSIKFNSDFGPLATIPITVLWLYLNWLLILFGILIISMFRKSSSGESFQLSQNQRFHKLQLDIRVLLDSKEYSNLKYNLKENQFSSILDVINKSINNDKNGEINEEESSD
jgi:membrane protein